LILAKVQVGEVDSFIQVHPQEGDYYVLEGRVLRALKDRQALPAEARGMPAGRMRGLYQVLDETGRLEDGEPGYGDAKTLSGIVVEALGRDGRPLLFVGVRGGEVSNDHHPYYEFLFARDSADAHWKLLSIQRFSKDSSCGAVADDECARAMRPGKRQPSSPIHPNQDRHR
jgi:hypothetical protein